MFEWFVKAMIWMIKAIIPSQKPKQNEIDMDALGNKNNSHQSTSREILVNNKESKEKEYLKLVFRLCERYIQAHKKVNITTTEKRILHINGNLP